MVLGAMFNKIIPAFKNLIEADKSAIICNVVPYKHSVP